MLADTALSLASQLLQGGGGGLPDRGWHCSDV